MFTPNVGASEEMLKSKLSHSVKPYPTRANDLTRERRDCGDLSVFPSLPRKDAMCEPSEEVTIHKLERVPFPETEWLAPWSFGVRPLCFLTNAHEAISFPLSTNLPASPKI
jgi:hypothetical protein